MDKWKLIDEDILDKYNHNKEITSGEIDRLYKLVDNPWNLLNDSNIINFKNLLTKLDLRNSINESTIIDFGCGFGQLKRAFDELDLRYQHFYGVDRLVTDSDYGISSLDSRNCILKDEEKAYFLSKFNRDYFLTKGNKLRSEYYHVFFINSIYYLFNDLKSTKKIDRLTTFISNIINEFEVDDLNKISFYVVNSGFKYEIINKVFNNLEFITTTKFYIDADNDESQFKTKYRLEKFEFKG